MSKRHYILLWRMCFMDEFDVKSEINRCFNCINKPCYKACPLNNDIPNIITLMKNNNMKDAYSLLSSTTVLPSVCGRICPCERQCRSNCTRKYKGEAIDIGTIESFLGDMAISEGWKLSKLSDNLKGKKIAVIGSGPAGLTCAAFLRRNGAEITIYERKEHLGGLLRYGIPEFRLEKKLLDKAIGHICNTGINVVTNYNLNNQIEGLKSSYDAIFLSLGSNIPKKMNIAGENLPWVFDGNEILENGITFDCVGKKVFVCGGGNVALDTARTIKKLGASEVTILYRREEGKMPAEKREVATARKEKIEFRFNTNILRIYEHDGNRKIECVDTCEVGLELKNVPDSKFELEADFVIMAIGSKPDENLIKKLGLETDKNGFLKIDENNRTSDSKIFAGGNLVGAKATVAYAARSGRDAADSIMKILK